MTRKLLVARIGAGSITIALCAALPGCNLAVMPVAPPEGCASARFPTPCPLDGAAPDRATDTSRDAVGDRDGHPQTGLDAP